MQLKYLPDKIRYQRMTSEELRQAFLVEELFASGKVQLCYVDVDRAIVGTTVPTSNKLTLPAEKALAADYFAQRREIGVINIGKAGTVTVDGQDFNLANRDSLYIGRGSKQIEFTSLNESNPAQFYLLSFPAHKTFPAKLITREQANRVPLGSDAEANKRTIFQSICPGVVESCQVVMGFTELAEGSVWNTMPAHSHARRSEIYMYFDLEENARVFHLMGEPAETRHLVMQNHQAVVSPSWSIHAGAGTSNYAFIWGMGGENQEFTDMDGVEMKALK
ncbi:MAG: 5-dehydro-4-deoxy-D-glucuronate isomerase [bacterium]